MKWTEVKVETASEAVEAISNIMMEAGASGVAIEDALDIENFESDLYGEILDKEQFTHIKEGAIVMAYFPETTFLPEILPFMKENILRLPEYGLSIGKNEMTISEVAEGNCLEKILSSCPCHTILNDCAKLGSLSRTR